MIAVGMVVGALVMIAVQAFYPGPGGLKGTIRYTLAAILGAATFPVTITFGCFFGVVKLYDWSRQYD